VAESSKPQPEWPVIGWREWVKLPDLGKFNIKVKVDTGARSSALHAFDLEEFTHLGKPWVRFKTHPRQRSDDKIIEAEAPILDYRKIRSSTGNQTKRPVIITNVLLLGVAWPVELTLVDRASMGFRMLLGRQAVRGRFVVDSGGSYYGGKPKRMKRTKRSNKTPDC